MEVPKKTRQQLNMDVPIETHRMIKIAAADRYISLNKWIMRAIEKQLLEEGKFK